MPPLPSQDAPPDHDDPELRSRAGVARAAAPGLFPASSLDSDADHATLEDGSLLVGGFSLWLNGEYPMDPGLQENEASRATAGNDTLSVLDPGRYHPPHTLGGQQSAGSAAFDAYTGIYNWTETGPLQSHSFVQPQTQFPSALSSPPVSTSPFRPSMSREGSDSGAVGDVSFEEPYTGISTPYTAQSDSSIGSVDSLASSASIGIRKRRRRRRATPRVVADRRLSARRYQCTFCTDSYKTKYDWQRHETTMHLSLEQWQCAKSGPFTQQPDGSTCCVFCGQLEPTPDHTSAHRYSACLAKPLEERIFRRKDHLRQHLRHVHNGCSFNEKMEAWFSSIEMVNSRCGFCSARLTSWAERQKHLAHHFKRGVDMKDWKGGRGFDECIDLLVENDMPAFMIGDQRNTLEPFSASQAAHISTGPADADANNLAGDVASSGKGAPKPGVSDSLSQSSVHSYRDAETLLLAHVSEELGNGRVPSDGELQKKTSEIIYGPGNEWDQTWADNPEWLELFKKKAGLIRLPCGSGRNAFVGRDEGLDN